MSPQQELAPTSAMPIPFTETALRLPSRLTLNIFTNTLLTMVHRCWMNRRDADGAKPGVGKTLKPARA